MVRQHHKLNGHEIEQNPGDSEGQGSLAYCSPWSHIELDTLRDSKRDTDVQNSLMDSEREGEGGKIQENGIETCKISCMKCVASPGSMHDTGCLGLVHWDDPEGWNRREEGSGWGTHVYLWRIHFDIWQN